MRTFILRHDSNLSREYAAVCAQSCEDLNIEYEYFEGFSNMLGSDAQKQIGVIERVLPTNREIDHPRNRGQLCTASHLALWKKMVDEDIPVATILEHDAIMLHRCDIPIPDGTLVCFGYKTDKKDRYKYEHLKPEKLTPIKAHRGSHAYALTKGSAKMLVDGVKARGTAGCIDSHVFTTPRFRAGLNMSIVDPICAIAWCRESTIQKKASTGNSSLIASYKNNLR